MFLDNNLEGSWLIHNSLIRISSMKEENEVHDEVNEMMMMMMISHLNKEVLFLEDS